MSKDQSSFPIYRDVAVPIREKQVHIRKIGGRRYHSFIDTYGDLPGAVFTENGIQEVVNPRGRAYAARRRLKHRKGAFIKAKNASI
jgi:hypothetical protein